MKLEGVESVKRIEKGALYNTTIEEYPNWEALTEIGDQAFSNSWIKSVYIPFGCKLGKRVFEWCGKLKTIELPADCPDDIHLQFECCSSISLIRMNAVTPPSLSSDWAYYLKNPVLEVPSESLELYRNAPYWKDFPTIRALTSEVEEVSGNSFNVIGTQGTLSVESAEEVRVYDMQGNCIHTGCRFELNLAPGVYIVSTSSESRKVQVL